MKVRISTKSWHYRLLGFYDFSIPQNLCPYFWKVVGTLVATPFIVLCMLIAAPIFALADRRKPRPPKPYNPSKAKLIGRALTIFFYGWCIGFGIYDIYIGSYIFAGIMFGLVAFSAYARIRKLRHLYTYEEKPKKEKEPNIAIEYLKAKKHKYCPMIEFVGMDERKDEEWEKWR